MNATVKAKHVILQEFTDVLLRRNPMQLGQENPLEYESEALSILSRFNESALHLPDDESAVTQVATSIVRQSLEFWFDNLNNVDPEPIARELIVMWRLAHGHSVSNTEQVHVEDVVDEEKELLTLPKIVTEVTIGE